jgi:hypothetical protein
VSRSAHGDAERSFAQANLKRLFGDKVIFGAADLPVAPFCDLRHVDAALFVQHEFF